MASVADSPSALHRSAAAHRPLPPLPPEWIPLEGAFPRSPLGRFVVLSLLLHALAIALFGAPPGGTREGRALWGSLQVQLARIAPRPAPVEAPPTLVPEAPSATTDREPVREPAIPFPPLLDRIPEVTFDSLPPLLVPPPSEAPIETAIPPAVRFESLPPLASAGRLPDLAPVPAIKIPAEIPAIAAPLLQPIQPLPERSALPQMQPVPAIRVPVETPRIAAPLLQPIQPLDRVALPPMAPAFRPEVPIATPEPLAPAATERPAMRPPPTEARPPSSSASEPAAAAPSPRAPVASESPSPSSPPREERARRESPAIDDPTRPALDLDAIRKRAGQLGTGQRAVLPFPMPPIPERKSKMEEAIEKARKPDCREAYKGLGLAAVVPLIANEFGEGTCRW